VALIGYGFLVCLIPAWLPGNASYFSILYGGAGFCLAFLLPPWRLTRKGRRLLHLTAVLLFCYACLGNSRRPLIGYESAFTGARAVAAGNVEEGRRLLAVAARQSIWLRTRWGTDRLAEARLRFGDDRVAQALQRLPAGSRVVLLWRDATLLYPYLLHGPHLDLHPVAAGRAPLPEVVETLRPGYLISVDQDLGQAVFDLGAQVVWSSSPRHPLRQGTLLRLP
jgi:hypothetical protein